MSDNSGGTGIPRMKAREMSKKIPFSGQKSEQREMNIFQWYARGLSSPKMTEIKKTINEENFDVLIINEANVTKGNINFYNMKGYTIYALYKSCPIASGILTAVKTTLTTKFHITKEINKADMSEIIRVIVWVEKTQFRIYGLYNLPNNKNLNLDILNIMNSTIIMEDFNAGSTTWGYTYQNHPEKTVEEHLNSNSLTLLYEPGESKTFIHYSGSTTNPDLVIVSTTIADQCKWTIIGDPRRRNSMTKTSLKLKTSEPTPSK